MKISPTILEYQYIAVDKQTAELIHKLVNQVPLSAEDVLLLTRGKTREIVDALVKSNAKLLQLQAINLLAKSLSKVNDILSLEDLSPEDVIKATKLLLDIYQKLKVHSFPLAEATDDITAYINQKLSEQ